MSASQGKKLPIDRFGATVSIGFRRHSGIGHPLSGSFAPYFRPLGESPEIPKGAVRSANLGTAASAPI